MHSAFNTLAKGPIPKFNLQEGFSLISHKLYTQTLHKYYFRHEGLNETQLLVPKSPYILFEKKFGDEAVDQNKYRQ